MSWPAEKKKGYACVLCRQRKVKCDREYPCGYCVRASVPCVPRTNIEPHQRRRRFPERALLERVRHYEDILRRHHIPFEPLHKVTSETADPGPQTVASSEHASPNAADTSAGPTSPVVKSEPVYKGRDLLNAIRGSTGSPEADDDDSVSSGDEWGEPYMNTGWDSLYPEIDTLLFEARHQTVNISSLHPPQVHMFKLWQAYLDNVNPILKVTHIPSLQPRIIDAAGDTSNISAELAALLFSIYGMAVISMPEEDCVGIFHSSKVDLLSRFQYGCRQALIEARFLRSNDLDCATAMFLHLVSSTWSTTPRSLSASMGSMIRVAQRIGLDSEAANAKCNAIEGQMRRRLWWAIVLFDARSGELAFQKATSLTPTWDCKPPQNVNDFDLQPGMKQSPPSQEHPSETVLAVVRSEIGDVARRSAWHLDFTTPAFKMIVEAMQQTSAPETPSLDELEQSIETRFLKNCNPENPLHFMTIWTARSLFARNRLYEFMSRNEDKSTPIPETQRTAVITYAQAILECNTHLMTSPLTKGYQWFTNFYYPLIAYIYLLQMLRRQPLCAPADRAWDVIAENYLVNNHFVDEHGKPFIIHLSKAILHAWHIREAALRAANLPIVRPRVIPFILARVGDELADPRPPSNETHARVFGSLTISQCASEPSLTTNSYESSMSSSSAEHIVTPEMDPMAWPPPLPNPMLWNASPEGPDWFAMDWNLLNSWPQ